MDEQVFQMCMELSDKFFELFNELGSSLIESVNKLTVLIEFEDDGEEELSFKEGDDVVVAGTEGIAIGIVRKYPNGEFYVDVAR